MQIKLDLKRKEKEKEKEDVDVDARDDGDVGSWWMMLEGQANGDRGGIL